MIAVWIAIGFLTLLTAVLTVSQLAIYTHFGRMYITSEEGRANQGPQLGSRPKPATLRRLSGEVDELPWTGVDTLVVFASITCSACNALKPSLAILAQETLQLRVAFVCMGTLPQVEQWAMNVDPAIVVFADAKGSMAARYGAPLTPAFALFDHEGTVKGSGILRDIDQIRMLLSPSTDLQLLDGVR